ncbi:MAG: GntG family PLP-dependent aldolase [Saprospiraceae bacterium]
MNKIINLISDTATRPTAGMLEAMMNAEVGDDVFHEDPTVIALENRLADMFGHQAGLFCPSGTMSNQIAIKCHTRPLDEMICDIHSHVYQYEVGGYAFHSQIAVNPVRGEQGILTAELIEENIKDLQDWLPRTRLAVIENSGNRTGGNCYSLEQMRAVSASCCNHGIKIHLDGARIFNALIATQLKPQEIGPFFDSISICLSKGLGTPAGTVLLGPKDWIAESRRIRKAMGGGMRQVGILAAAGLYALDFHVIRLAEDHRRARKLESILRGLACVESVTPVQTNIVIFNLAKNVNPADFVSKMKAHGVNSSAFGKQSIRLVTHLDIDDAAIDYTETVLKRVSTKL